MATVYLSGGMCSEWRTRVIDALPMHRFISPTLRNDVEIELPSLYTQWDLAAIRASDIVFAYMEASNPSGFGIAVEVGYAAALGKLIIFVDEVNNEHFAIVRNASSVSFDSLSDGITYLASVTW